jgi:F-type H+-transporting ATPase subunit epsilon
MFDRPFALEIIAPNRVVFHDQVAAVRVPGTQGGFQVLYGHAPLLSSIEVGSVIVKGMDGVDHLFATSGGTVEVRANHMVVLVESAEAPEEIDVDRAVAARKRAEQRLHERGRDIDLMRAEAALHRALNRLRVAGSPT